MNKTGRCRFLLAAVPAVLLLSGCFESKRALHYLGDADLDYYKETATAIEFPDVHQQSPDEVISTHKPRTLADRHEDEVWELSLSDTIHLALQNNRVIRTDGAFLSPGNALFTNPDRAASVYDPAIQESGVLFGGRGVEAALAAFDAQWNTSMLWGRNENFVNNLFNGGGQSPGASFVSESANFNTGLSKTFGYGASLGFRHDVDYLGTNSPAQLFPSAYTGSLSAQYRQPLLAGAGTEFTRIAGPIGQSFGGITGVNQGVVIARINNDITIADFEGSVLDLLLDVERLYWDLYLAYVRYDTAVKARNSAQRTWRDIKTTLDVLNDVGSTSNGAPIQTVALQNRGLQAGREEIRPSDEAQARDAYYQARVATERALSDIYTTEGRFRRLLGLAVNDGRIIRPLDSPSLAEFTPDWTSSLVEALTQRFELRKQKWNIKSLELQLKAAKSLTKPRLDFISQYRVNGLGDQLIDDDNGDGVTTSGLGNLYGTLARNNQTGWGLGFEMSVPLGYRSANAQVRNIELRLAKAREVLAVQEIEVSHEVANAMQELALHYQNTQSLYNRRVAADALVEVKRIELQGGESTPDELIRAISSQAQAEAAYFESLVRYNQALAIFQYRKGSLLAYNHVHLAEGDWDAEAYNDALRRARERSHAIDNPFVSAEPAVFSQGTQNRSEVWVNPAAEPLPEPAPAHEETPATEPAAPPAPPAAPVETSSAHGQTLNLTRPRTPSFQSEPVARGNWATPADIEFERTAAEFQRHEARERQIVEPRSDAAPAVQFMPISFDETPATTTRDTAPSNATPTNARQIPRREWMAAPSADPPPRATSVAPTTRKRASDVQLFE